MSPEKKTDWAAWFLVGLLILLVALNTRGLIAFYSAAPYYFVAGALSAIVLILRPLLQGPAIRLRQPPVLVELRSVQGWDRLLVCMAYMAFVFSALNGLSAANNPFFASLPIAFALSLLSTFVLIQAIQIPNKSAVHSGNWSDEDRDFSQRAAEAKILLLPIGCVVGALALTLSEGPGPPWLKPINLALLYVGSASFMLALLLFQPSHLREIGPTIRFGAPSIVALVIALGAIDADWLRKNWFGYGVSSVGFLSLVAAMSRVWAEMCRHRNVQARADDNAAT